MGLVFIFSPSLTFISPFSCFYFSMLLLLCFLSLLHLASLCSLFFFFGHVPPCSAWPVLRGGLAALCLVSQLPVWTRGALLRRLGHRRCECEFDSVPARVLHPNSHVHCLSARGIEERFVSQSSIWLLVGKAGWLASGMRGRLSAISASFVRPSTVLPIVALPRNRRTGHMRGVQDFFKNSEYYGISQPYQFCGSLPKHSCF